MMMMMTTMAMMMMQPGMPYFKSWWGLTCTKFHFIHIYINFILIHWNLVIWCTSSMKPASLKIISRPKDIYLIYTSTNLDEHYVLQYYANNLYHVSSWFHDNWKRPSKHQLHMSNMPAYKLCQSSGANNLWHFDQFGQR